MSDEAHELAFAVVQRIDADLTSGRRHYRDRAGRLLTTLEQVVRAILADDLHRVDIPPIAGLGRSMKWLKENRQNYQGEWIAIKNGELLGHAPSREELPRVPERETIITRIPQIY